MSKTKKQRIREHLELGNSITQRDAYELFNHTRLAAVIHEFKNDPVNPLSIEKEDVVKTNMSGDKIRYTEYRLKNPIGNKDQLSMFSEDAKIFRSWMDKAPKLKKGDIR